MDINMPFKSGLEAKKEVCELYENSNKAWSEQKQEDEAPLLNKEAKVSIIRPFICYQTQLSDSAFHESFVSPEEKADCVLSKPLQQKQLTALCEILGLI